MDSKAQNLGAKNVSVFIRANQGERLDAGGNPYYIKSEIFFFFGEGTIYQAFPLPALFSP